ncbi:tRNA (adenine(58)-N(1))-methyltransferase catalytic subunit TRMT61A [Cephus cinctus]|uniref:tRNA (adenine(58)-N(1))-methyltransferase catalytic subunit TRMT61A n=1 Tax=Cephus cinctus TaxID=211228 RepID=A0AAJ7FCN9_CEPCN|nr:tRNA (adenine(58)-N(1))-methyltransferase catalytic subunit TRMT61A [Cephus cinctus]
MSFNKAKEYIEEGDTVILYLGPNNMHSIDVVHKIMNKKGELTDNVFQTIYGALKVPSLVGEKYGAKVQLSRGWAYVLQPTSELWTVTLPHRTQIIYTPDISLITYLLELVPGSIVVETGTGSGSLSHSLIRIIQPLGHLYTFDFHEQRASLACAEFEKHGLSDFVTVQHRDVCADGFGEKLNNKADAIFLDLPHPWLTIDHAVKTLKNSGGKLCSFSPCIEQVQRTCEKLTATGFVDLKTYECLEKELSVQYKSLPVLDLECLKHKRISEEAIDKVEKNEEDRRKYEKILTVTHSSSLPGHTGFITIATLPPVFARIIKTS